ncbi:MAG: electron transfer flavoprotein subunit beta/FixA family protein [Thermoplasmatota archaeon]
MRFLVLVKQVPDTTEVRIDPKTNTLIREGVESIMNPYDQFALEEALRLKASREDVRVTVLSMGPPQARRVLLKALALGADDAVLLSDRAFAGSDTWATSVAISKAIRKMGKADVVFCGLQAIDGDTAQVGPETAQLLGIPQITYAESVEVESGSIRARQQTEEGVRILKCMMPVLVTCVPPPSFMPRIAPLKGIVEAGDKPYEVWDIRHIEGDPAEVGLKGSPTQVKRTYSPPARGGVMIVEGSPREAAARLAGILFDRKLIGEVR